MNKKFKNILPIIRPEIVITPKRTIDFDVTLKEVIGMYCDLQVGKQIIWGIYDQPNWKLSDCAISSTVRKAKIHGIDCIEVQVEDYNNPTDEEPKGKYNLYIHYDDNQIQYVAKSQIKNDIYEMVTIYDDEFISNYEYEMTRKISNTGFTVYESNDLLKLALQLEDNSILTGAGVFEVSIGGEKFECLRVIDKSKNNSKVLVEHYINRNGRTILFRRYNHVEWKKDKYKQLWSDKLPNAQRLFLNNEMYIHWYDCLSSTVFDK